jgi:metallophosphoesterase superfamily enzyme
VLQRQKKKLKLLLQLLRMTPLHGDFHFDDDEVKVIVGDNHPSNMVTVMWMLD